jgi:preprotein translocase subunit SecE
MDGPHPSRTVAMSPQRILLLSYIVLGLLLALTLENLLGGLFSSVAFLGFLNHTLFGSENWSYATVLGWGLGLAAALWCWRDPRVKTPATEVVDELTRVSWPSLPETRAATWAVIVTTLVFAVILGAFDFGWSALTSVVYAR